MNDHLKEPFTLFFPPTPTPTDFSYYMVVDDELTCTPQGSLFTPAQVTDVEGSHEYLPTTIPPKIQETFKEKRYPSPLPHKFDLLSKTQPRVNGNNPTGRKGKPRCTQCRKAKSKVTHKTFNI